MRVECDNCGAKYSIADDKIVGRVFKVRCKKCSTMITVDGTALADGETEEATRIFDPSAAGAQSEAVWYVVIDGSQTGPLTPDEVSEQIRNGAVDSETFAWREGMDDWIQLSEIAELAALVAPRVAAPAAAAPAVFDEEATRVVAAGEYETESEFAHGKPLAATPAPAAAPAPFSASVPRATGSDFFSAGAARTNDPFTAPASASASATSANKALGQRNESSVLFSLADLTSGSGGKGSSSTRSSDALPRTEGSGLIDIRVLAGAQATTALGAVPGPASSPGTVSMGVVPMAPLIPMPTKKSNTGLVVALGIAAVVIIGLLAAIVVVLMRPSAPPPVVVAEVAPAPVVVPTPEPPAPPVVPTPEPVVAVAAPVEGSADAAVGSGAPPEEVAVVAEAPAVEQRSEANERQRTTERPAGTTTATRVPVAERETAPVAAPAPSRTERTREGGDEAVASALSAIRGRPEPAAEPAAPAPTPAPAAATTGLSRSDVQATIRRYASRVSGCGNDTSEGQSYRVSFVIQPGGSVTNVSAADSGDVPTCVAGVVRDMTFPRFEGDPQPVTYPFRF